jgi:broad specificity phosphatase PhoE
VTVRLLVVCQGSTTATTRAGLPDGEPLTERGRREAIAAAATITGTAGGSVSWCSPAPAARQTVAALGVTAEIDSGMRDCDFGRWRGRRLADVQATEPEAVPTWLTDPAANPHGGESDPDVIDRAAVWLTGHADHGGRVIAITHAAVIRAAVLHVQHASATSFWRIDVPPLSRVCLTGDGGRWQVRATP